jgi:hypothetical protein
MMSPFEKLLDDLVKGDVRYVTVGGIACAFAGHVRATQDVDILVSPEPENIRRLLDALEHFGEGHARKLDVSDFSVQPGAIRIVEDFPLDVFTVMAEKTYDDMQSHIKWWQREGVKIPYLDARGLILLKSDSPRPRDQQDVAALQNILALRSDHNGNKDF